MRFVHLAVGRRVRVQVVVGIASLCLLAAPFGASSNGGGPPRSGPRPMGFTGTCGTSGVDAVDRLSYGANTSDLLGSQSTIGTGSPYAYCDSSSEFIQLLEAGNSSDWIVTGWETYSCSGGTCGINHRIFYEYHYSGYDVKTNDAQAPLSTSTTFNMHYDSSSGDYEFEYKNPNLHSGNWYDMQNLSLSTIGWSTSNASPMYAGGYAGKFGDDIGGRGSSNLITLSDSQEDDPSGWHTITAWDFSPYVYPSSDSNCYVSQYQSGTVNLQNYTDNTSSC